MSCGVGCGRGSDPTLLWLWCRLTATALIRPLAWEPPYAESKTKKKEEGGGRRRRRKRKKRKSKKKKAPFFPVTSLCNKRVQHLLIPD